MKIIKVKCDICGEVELPRSFSDMNDEGISIPTAYAPTIMHLGRVYSDIEGSIYEIKTGNSIGKSFEKTFITPLHTNPDEDGEDWEKHKLESIEVWNEII